MTSLLVETATLHHPSWCSPADCQAAEPGGGAHRSRPVQVQSPSAGLLVSVQLVQDLPIDGYPDSDRTFVSLIARFPDYGPDHPAEDYPLCLDVEHARAIGRTLVIAGRQAMDDEA